MIKCLVYFSSDKFTGPAKVKVQQTTVQILVNSKASRVGTILSNFYVLWLSLVSS